MADKNILKQLGGLKGMWKKARERANEGGSWENLPDGKYIAQLSTAELGNSEKGRFQCKMEYVVKEGEQAGQSIYKYMGLDKEESLDWMAKELVRLGVDATQLEAEELPAALEGLVKSKPTVRLKLRTKGEYQNCYIEKLVDSDETDGGDSEAAGEAGEAADENQDAVEAAEAGEPVEGETEVTFTIKGKEGQSVILKIDEAKGYMVELDGKKYWVKAEACTVVEAASDEAEEVVEEAEEVEEVEEVVEEKPAAKPKPKPGPKTPPPAAKEPDEVELAVGMKVSFTHKGKKLTSPVKKIDEKAGMVYVQVGKEQVKLKPEDLTLIPEGKDS